MAATAWVRWGALGGALALAGLAQEIAVRKLVLAPLESHDVAPPRLRDIAPTYAATALLGFRALTADVAWIDAGQYYSDSTNYGEGWRSFPALVRQAVRLSPRWTRAYEYGGLALGWVLNRPSEARVLFEEGMRENPSYERFPRYLAGLAATKAKDDKALIALLEALAEDPGRPLLLDRTLAFLYERNGEKEKAVAAWARVLTQANDGSSRVLAARHLRALGVAPESIGGR